MILLNNFKFKFLLNLMIVLFILLCYHYLYFDFKKGFDLSALLSNINLNELIN